MARLDPYWMFSRYKGGQCPTCKKVHGKGEKIFYYPATRAAYCSECGVIAHADFMAHCEADSW